MKSKKSIFIEDCGIFKNNILVCVGTSYEDIFLYAQQKKIKKEAMEDLKNGKDIINGLIANQIGFVFELASSKGYLLWLKEYSWKSWTNIECLLHELHHLVDFTARQKSFENEIEAKAFLFENLFSKIRHRLHRN